MKAIPAAIGLAVAILVGAASLNWSEQANSESCSLRAANMQAPSQAAADDLPSAEFRQFLRDHPGLCQPQLSFDQKLDAALGGVMVGFIVYVFLLLFGKFHRWVAK